MTNKGVWAIRWSNQPAPNASRFLLTCNEGSFRGASFTAIKNCDSRWFIYGSIKILGKWRSWSWLQKKA